jgi:hypothetical protein
MQLVQIGQTPTKTLQQLIEEMSARQSTEVAELKQAAPERYAAAQLRHTSKTVSRRNRCERRSI